MKNTYVIGDIHGGMRGIQQLIQRMPLLENDRIIFTGDYVDGWSESAQVIVYLMELRKKYDCIFIKGNHDLWFENWLKTRVLNQNWLQHGGQETVDSYRDISLEDRQVHLAFLEEDAVMYYIDEDNRLFIHAGYSTDDGPSAEFVGKMSRWDRSLWDNAFALKDKISNREDYPERYKLFSQIYLGHTPTQRYGSDLPLHALNVWNIDTGAAYLGCITAMCIESNEYWQSDPVHLLYPDEIGRNKKKK